MWKIELLDNLCIRQDDVVIHQFRTRKTGSLLAYLAFYADRYHQRDALIEMLWPDSDIESGRNLLRVTLSSLRHHLEPPTVSKSSVLVANRSRVQLASRLYTIDAREFAALIEAARVNNSPEEQTALLEKAAVLYKGPLLPEYDETWILSERERLAEAAYKVLLRLVNLMLGQKRNDRALDYANRAVHLEPAREEAHRALMRMYAAMNRPDSGLKHYHALEMVLRDTFGCAPSAATQEVLQQLETQRSGGRKAGADARPRTGAINGLPTEAVPARTLQSSPIPYRKTSFFGREEEREKLRALLSPGRERLVTITGMAGCGKTRTALEAVRDLTGAYQDAVWFIDLSEIDASDGFLPAIIQTVDPQRIASGSPVETLKELFARAPALLLLDNFEQLLAPSALQYSETQSPVPGVISEVVALLDALPQLTLLVTSRQRLGITGEREIPLSPLPIPDPDLSLNKLMEFAGVRIFVDRASAANPAFQIGTNNAPAVAALCRDLEGIPLAIELAAEWACTLTPAQMRQFLKHRFSLLVSRKADQTQRHRALHSALEHSHRLLNDSLRRLFAGLSVFRGGWTLEAALAVFQEEAAVAQSPAGTDPSTNSAARPASIQILTDLSELQRRSLLFCIETGNAMRYHYLETLREYASEKLSTTDRAQFKMRHACHFTEWAESLAPQITGAQSDYALSQLELESNNLRAAFDWCVEAGQAELGLRLVAALHLFWTARGRYREAREQIGRVLRLPEAQKPTKFRARALQAAWMLARDTGDMPAVMALMEEGLTTLRALNDEMGAAAMLNNMGNAAICMGDLERAERLFSESLGTHRKNRNPAGLANPLNNLGEIAMRRGEVGAACRYFKESLGHFRAAGNEEGIAGSLLNYGSALLLNGESKDAESAFLESLSGWTRLRNMSGVQEVVRGFIELNCLREEWDTAAVLMGQLEMLEQRDEKLVSTRMPEALAARKDELRRRLSESKYERCVREGREMSFEALTHLLEQTSMPAVGEIRNTHAVVVELR